MSLTPWRKGDKGGVAAVSHAVMLDDGRGPPLPLTCRWPEQGDPKAVIVFCHGLGANGRDYGRLTAFWAAHGYIVVHPTFADAIKTVARAEPALGLDPEQHDLSEWTAMPEVRKRMHEILHAPAYWMKRIETVSRVADGLGRILSQIHSEEKILPWVIAGHSFGAYTTQQLAGVEFDFPGQGPRRVRDDRFSAAIILSGQGRDQQGLRDGSWDHIEGPVLTVTGTRDGGAKGQDWRWKCEPYDLGPTGDKYLVVLEDADHFLGGFAQKNQNRPEQMDALRAVTLAFMDACVLGEASAGSWLSGLGAQIGDAPVIFRRK